MVLAGATAFSGVGQIWLRRLNGWHPSMEMPDILHVVYLGTSRDSNGSLCMDLIEMDPRYGHLATFDERLKVLLGEMQGFFESHGIRPSTVDELSP